MNLPSGFGSTQRSSTPPLEVSLKRGSSVESIHRVHAVVCAAGRQAVTAASAVTVTVGRTVAPLETSNFELA